MQNPILQMLNVSNQMNSKLNAIKSIISGKNPEDLYKTMIETNPQFRQFVKDNENKTIEEIAMSYDIDLNLLKKFM